MINSFIEKIKNNTIKISIVGLGYVGLPTAIYFAEKEFNVIGVDKNRDKLFKINKGISTIGELNLDDSLLKVIKNKNLITTNNLKEATEDLISLS